MGEAAVAEEMPVKPRTYTDEENLRIFETLHKVKTDDNIEFNKTAEVLAEEFGVSSWAIKQKYYAYNRKLRKRLEQKVDHSSPSEGYFDNEKLLEGDLITYAEEDAKLTKDLAEKVGDLKKPEVKRISAMNHFIYTTILQARESKLDMKIVHRHLADYLGLTVKALEVRFYSTQKLYKDGYTVEVDPSDEVYHLALPTQTSNGFGEDEEGEEENQTVVQEEQPTTPEIESEPISLADRVEEIKKERDMYKELYEELKAEMDKIRAILG